MFGLIVIETKGRCQGMVMSCTHGVRGPIRCAAHGVKRLIPTRPASAGGRRPSEGGLTAYEGGGREAARIRTDTSPNLK